MLVIAIVAINLALVAYSIGVWGERLQHTLKRWHTVFFCIGLAFDTTGTSVMTAIASSAGSSGGLAGGLVTLMAVSGTIAILLMDVHAAWAIVVLVRGRERELASFHRFSIVVWAIWLIPYLAGAIGSMLG